MQDNTSKSVVKKKSKSNKKELESLSSTLDSKLFQYDPSKGYVRLPHHFIDFLFETDLPKHVKALLHVIFKKTIRFDQISTIISSAELFDHPHIKSKQRLYKAIELAKTHNLIIVVKINHGENQYSLVPTAFGGDRLIVPKKKLPASACSIKRKSSPETTFNEEQSNNGSLDSEERSNNGSLPRLRLVVQPDYQWESTQTTDGSPARLPASDKPDQKILENGSENEIPESLNKLLNKPLNKQANKAGGPPQMEDLEMNARHAELLAAFFEWLQMPGKERKWSSHVI